MRIMEITGCEKSKITYSEFCSDNDLLDCFSTIVYFMDEQGIAITSNYDYINRTYGVQYTVTDSIRIHKKGGFHDRQDAEMFIAQEAFDYLENHKGGGVAW